MNMQVANIDAAPATTEFTVGNIYGSRSICNHDTIFSYKVVSRTAKRMTIVEMYGDREGDTKVRGIAMRDGVETCKPEGSYSMCPILRADRTVY